MPAEAIDEYVAVLSAPGALTAALNWYRAMSSGIRVDPVGVPTTYVWSDGDVAIGRTAAEACANYVTGDYRFVELPGVTHWIPEQARDAAGRRDPGPDRLAALRRRCHRTDVSRRIRDGAPAARLSRTPASRRRSTLARPRRDAARPVRAARGSPDAPTAVPVTSASRPASSSRSTGRRVTPAATWWKPALTRSTGTPVSRDQPSR